MSSPATSSRSSPVRVAGRWIGRVLLHGLGAGIAHACTVFAVGWTFVLIGVATTPSADLPLREHVSVLWLFVLMGGAAGLATATAVGLVTAPIAAATTMWARSSVRTALWVGPAVLWFGVSLLLSDADGPATAWLLVTGPTVWIAVAMRRLVRRWDPVDAARPRTPTATPDPTLGLHST